MDEERFPLWEEPRIRLWERLSEAAIAAAGKWAGYRYGDEALLTARYEQGRGIVVRVARAEKPATERERLQWEHFLQVTELFLGMGRGSAWRKRRDESAKGVAYLYEDFLERGRSG